MDGGAGRSIHMAPNGRVLPCHAKQSITNLSFENVRNAPLGPIWNDSPAMNAFRGDAWMPDLCKGCARKDVDFGGCRCQAFALTGNAAATDPTCALSSDHGLVRIAREKAQREVASVEETARTYLYRGPARRISGDEEPK